MLSASYFPTQNKSRSSLGLPTNGRSNDAVIKYIQQDIFKMKKAVTTIEEMGNQTAQSIPPNLSSEMKELHELYSKGLEQVPKHVFDPILSDLHEKIQQSTDEMNFVHDNEYVENTKSFLTTFGDDITQRLAMETQQAADNFLFCLDTRLKKIANSKIQVYQPQPLHTAPDIPTFEFPTAIPSSNIYSEKEREINSQDVYSQIVNQNTRLSNLIQRIETINRGRRERHKESTIPMLSDMILSDRRDLLTLKLKMETILSQKALKAKQEERRAKPDEIQDDPVSKEEFAQLTNDSENLFQKTEEQMTAVKDSIQIRVNMLKARLGILEAKLEEFGDFAGEPTSTMEYLEMKVEELVNNHFAFDDPSIAKSHRKKNAIIIYMQSQIKMYETISKRIINDLQSRMKRIEFSPSLIKK